MKADGREKGGFGMKHCQDIQVIIDPEVAGIDFEVRRPYFRMRGKPVTEEQAFDIIRRTDNFFRWDMRKWQLEDLVSDRFLLDNVWYSPNFYPHRGWVRPDGIIGMNDVTGKYPSEDEFLASILELKEEFPYLDFMVAVTDWDEIPDYLWELMGKSHEAAERHDDKLYRQYSDEYDRLHTSEDYPDFQEHIVYGIWVHDDKVELMAPERAKERYLEYNRLYGGADEAVFTMDYYEENNIHPVDFEYLCRCIRSFGLNPDEVLAKYEWTSEGLKYKRGGLGVEAISGGEADG